MKIAIHWFRRDLRTHDNHALLRALQSDYPVLPLFLFDTNILDRLPHRKDARVEFIHQSIQKLQIEFSKHESGILVHVGKPEEIWPKLLQQFEIAEVYTNHDYEPYGKNRDQAVADYLSSEGIAFKTYKDQVIFEKSEVTKDDGKPYTVFTPYKNKWKATLQRNPLPSYPSENQLSNLYKTETQIPKLEAIGFQPTGMLFPDTTVSEKLLLEYDQKRNYPALPATSKIGVHLRFGTISIREQAKMAIQSSDTWLNELIWRDFYHMILWHFPHVKESAFKKEYDQIEWRTNQDDFEKWCNGKTGYPLVDAGMRELNVTGFMHNRVRMVVASFLTKHLLIPWQWGEAYFAEKLLDFDLAANNGGWQWASSSGCDAAPYFRIFNPSEQIKKFDSNYEYIKKWVPEWGTSQYSQPMVEHTFARNRALATYAKTLKKQ
jgi:deoxyribodipyrimidine photo-lyase